MKAIFVAMSGVRVRNERLLELGLTLPGFVERGKVIASLPSLGLLTLAGLLPAHWQARYIEVDALTNEVLQEIASLDADVFFISSLAARIDAAYRLCDVLREAGRVVVLGGLHASALPDEAARHATSVVVGEGENVWSELLSDLEQQRLRPRYHAKASTHAGFGCGGVPRYDLLEPQAYNRLTLQTTRGCPLDCSFCAASRLISPYRRKPIDRIRQELEAMLEVWPQPFLELADDNTFVNKKWGMELARALAPYGIRWFTETDISVAEDDRLLEALAESGCAQLLIGLESTDESALIEADSKTWKARRRKSYLEAIHKIQSHGISVNGCFVHGFDADGPGVFEATLDFVLESGLTEVQVTVLTPFPGTGLYERLRRQERLLAERFWDRCTLFDVVYEPAQMSAGALEEGLHWLVGELYREDRVRERRARFTRCQRGAARRHRDGIATPAG